MIDPSRASARHALPWLVAGGMAVLFVFALARPRTAEPPAPPPVPPAPPSATPPLTGKQPDPVAELLALTRALGDVRAELATERAERQRLARDLEQVRAQASAPPPSRATEARAAETLLGTACDAHADAKRDADRCAAELKRAAEEVAAAGRALEARQRELAPVPLELALIGDRSEPASVTRRRAKEQEIELARERFERTRSAERLAHERADGARVRLEHATEWRDAVREWVRALGGRTDVTGKPPLLPLLTLELDLEPGRAPAPQK